MLATHLCQTRSLVFIAGLLLSACSLPVNRGVPACDAEANLNTAEETDKRKQLMVNFRAHIAERNFEQMGKFYSSELQQEYRDHLNSTLKPMEIEAYDEFVRKFDYVYSREQVLSGNKWRLHYKSASSSSARYSADIICENGEYRIAAERSGSVL